MGNPSTRFRIDYNTSNSRVHSRTNPSRSSCVHSTTNPNSTTDAKAHRIPRHPEHVDSQCFRPLEFPRGSTCDHCFHPIRYGQAVSRRRHEDHPWFVYYMRVPTMARITNASAASANFLCMCFPDKFDVLSSTTLYKNCTIESSAHNDVRLEDTGVWAVQTPLLLTRERYHGKLPL